MSINVTREPGLARQPVKPNYPIKIQDRENKLQSFGYHLVKNLGLSSKEKGLEGYNFQHLNKGIEELYIVFKNVRQDEGFDEFRNLMSKIVPFLGKNLKSKEFSNTYKDANLTIYSNNEPNLTKYPFKASKQHIEIDPGNLITLRVGDKRQTVKITEESFYFSDVESINSNENTPQVLPRNDLSVL